MIGELRNSRTAMGNAIRGPIADFIGDLRTDAGRLERRLRVCANIADAADILDGRTAVFFTFKPEVEYCYVVHDSA
jgi:hypothetical protein